MLLRINNLRNQEPPMPPNNVDEKTREDLITEILNLFHVGVHQIYPDFQEHPEIEENTVNFFGGSILVISQNEDSEPYYQVRFREVGDRSSTYTKNIKTYDDPRLATAAILGYMVETSMWESLP